MTVTKLRSEQQ